MIRRRPPRLGGRSARALAIAVFGMALLGACSADGEPALPPDATLPPDVSAPDVSAPDVTLPDRDSGDGGESAQPAPEPAPTPEPEPAPAPESGDSPAAAAAPDDEMTTEEWVLLIVLGLAVVAIIIWATSAATGHSQKKNQQQSDRRQRLNDISGGTRWLLDQGSMSVLQAGGEQVQGAWASVRPQVVDLEGKTAQLAAGSGDSQLDSSLTRLGRELTGLRGAIESYAVACADGSVDLVENTRQTVMIRRQQVETALQPVSAAQT